MMSRGTPAAVALTAVATLTAGLLAGCGSNPKPAAEPPPPSADSPATPEAVPEPTSEPPAQIAPCEVVTLDDAEELAGTPLGAGRDLSAGDRFDCTYTGPFTGPTAQVELYIGAGAKNIYDLQVRQDHELVPVPGIGEEAYEEDGYIFFRKGERWVAIRLVRLEDRTPYVPKLRALAMKVHDRI